MAFDFQGQAALIDNEYKMYSNDGGEHFALYNIISENRNLADAYPEKYEEMVAYLRRWKESQEISAQGADY